MSRLPLLLGLAAGLLAFYTLKSNERQIGYAIESTLAGEPETPGVDTLDVAKSFTFTVLPVVAFALVFCVASLLNVLISGGKDVPMAEAVVVIGQPVEPTPYVAYGSAPRTLWSDGVCDFCKDCGVCWSTMCCLCVPIGQLYERVFHARHACLIIAGGFTLSYTLYEHVMAPTKACQMDQVGHIAPNGGSYQGEMVACETEASTSVILVGALYSSATILLYVTVMLVRSRVRAAYNIAPSACGALDDCCCSFCCLPCVTCQIVRHLNVTSNTRYKLFSTRGTESATVGAPLV